MEFLANTAGGLLADSTTVLGLTSYPNEVLYTLLRTAWHELIGVTASLSIRRCQKQRASLPWG